LAITLIEAHSNQVSIKVPDASLCEPLAYQAAQPVSIKHLNDDIVETSCEPALFNRCCHGQQMDLMTY